MCVCGGGSRFFILSGKTEDLVSPRAVSPHVSETEVIENLQVWVQNETENWEGSNQGSGSLWQSLMALSVAGRGVNAVILLVAQGSAE